MSAADLGPFASDAANLGLVALDRLRPLQQAIVRVEWLIDPYYQPASAYAEWVFDLLGWIPGPEPIQVLRSGLELTDPRVKLFAALSLLRQTEPLSEAEIEPIAASTIVRERLWRGLGELGRREMMPRKWMEPEALAAGALSNWLEFPTELGAPPEEIELMGRFPVQLEDGGTADGFLFRFREFPKPWEPGGGWMAGVAGPYRDGCRHGQPWSAFTDWMDMTPEEHFESLYHP